MPGGIGVSYLYCCAWAQGRMRSVATSKSDVARMARFSVTDSSDSIFPLFSLLVETGLYLSDRIQQSLQHLGKRNLGKDHGQHRDGNGQNQRDERPPIIGKRLQMLNVLVAGAVIRKGAGLWRGGELLFTTGAVQDPTIVKRRAF